MPDDEDQIEEVIEVEGQALSASDTKFAVARRMITRIRGELEMLERLVSGDGEAVDVESLLGRAGTEEEAYGQPVDERSIEGVFDGERMIGEDGRAYVVPPNYASKSKLVEGDLMRLTISDNGRFLFKQRGPIERQRLMGTLVQDDRGGEWKVVANGAAFKVLPAAISFHKGEVGDDAVILVPKNAPSRWAAVENIIKKDGQQW